MGQVIDISRATFIGSQSEIAELFERLSRSCVVDAEQARFVVLDKPIDDDRLRAMFPPPAVDGYATKEA